MKTIFKTNIDQYRDVAWPVIDYKPNVGETVHVHPASETICKARHIPKRLEIINITHTNDGVIAELHYKKIDLETASFNGTIGFLVG